MGRGTYYAARAAGRAAVRERTRARQAKERAMQKNPELFQNDNNNQELGLCGTIFLAIVAIILAILLFS